MKLDGPAVQYLLSREFGNVTSEGIFRGTMFDYPMLYDVSIDMAGHVVLIPSHERPLEDADMSGTLCVCVGEESAQSAREANAAVLLIGGEVTFQHLYNSMQSIFVENERLDAQLRALVDTYAGFQPLLDACARLMGFSCSLIDEQYRLVCASSAGTGFRTGHHVDSAGADGSSGNPAAFDRNDAAKADTLEPDAIDLFMASQKYRYMRASHRAFAVPNSDNLMMKNVFSKNQLVGALLMEHDGDVLSARYVRFLLNYLGAFVEEAYGRIGSFGVVSIGSEHVKAAIQSILMEDATGYASLEGALVESGHAPGCECMVLRMERSFTNEGADERGYLAHRLELAWPHAYCFIGEDGLFMLVDVSEGACGYGKAFAKELPLVARENLAKVGISRTFTDMADFDAARIQASIAFERGGEVDPTSWCYRYDDYAFSWLVAQATRDTPPAFVCHSAVTTLARYDKRHGTNLLGTLSVFMKRRYNATSAANELLIARSTLLHRLARIEELTGLDFEDSDDLTYLAFSLAMVER